MRTPEAQRSDARARAQALLAATTNEDEAAIVAAARSDPDAQPVDAAGLDRMRPISAGDAQDLARRARGRPRLAAAKRPVSLRLDSDVVERFRATGPGWQTRINEILREHLPERAD